MDIQINYENEPKASFFDVLKSFFSNSENKEEKEIAQRVEEIEKQQDNEYLNELLKVVKVPQIKKAKFNDKNIKAKVEAKRDNNSIKAIDNEKEQDEYLK